MIAESGTIELFVTNFAIQSTSSFPAIPTWEGAHKNTILIPLETKKEYNNTILLIKKYLGLCCSEKFRKLVNELYTIR